MSNICQHLHAFCVEVCFTRIRDFTQSFSDCEELVGVTKQGMMRGVLQVCVDFNWRVVKMILL